MVRFASSVVLFFACIVGHTFGAKLPNFKTRYDSLVSRCEPIKIDICKGQPYNQTHFPNLLGHETQATAQTEITAFMPLLRVNCSPDLLPFLCSLYAPVCISVANSASSMEMLIPCRHNCRRVRKGCAKVMKKYGFNWPQVLRCKRFPQKKSNALCIDWRAKEAVKEKSKKKKKAGTKSRKKNRRGKKKGKKNRKRRT